jgi:hypothetical protein
VSETRAPKCRGLLGWIFGHKFMKQVGGYIYSSDHCYWCGVPKGALR